jgi:hypothetical protein
MRFRVRIPVAASFLLALSVAIPSSADLVGPHALYEPQALPGLQALPALTEAPAEPATKKSCTPADQCCQICTKGKACGKSCIQATKTCHKGRGCACDQADVCPAGP